MRSSTLLSALFLTATTSAAATLPSRTHCRCTITLPDSASPSPPSTYRDSLENPDTLIPTTATPPDLCVALGPSLENLRTTNPDLYASYVSRTTDVQQRDAADAAQRPLSTSVLLRLAAQTRWKDIGVVMPASSSRIAKERKEEEEQRMERIECRTESSVGDEAWSAYQVSWVTLVVLQVVIALVVIACVAEGVMFGMRWMASRTPTTLVALPLPLPIPGVRPARLRLSGEEQRLLAVPTHDRNDMRSPGVEKKMRVYASQSWKVQRYAYIEDEDDEFNRPVM